MTQIQVKNLSFGYDENYEDVFHDISLCFDTDMKIALIGRNARGKNHFFKIVSWYL